MNLVRSWARNQHRSPSARRVVEIGCVLVALAGCGDAPDRPPAPDPVVSVRQQQSDPSARVQVCGHSATASASSELASDDGRYAAAMAFDGNPETAWVEGVAGYGGAFEAGEVSPPYDPVHPPQRTQPGERLSVAFDEPVVFDGVALKPGFLKSTRLYERNGVPFEVEVAVDGAVVGTYTLPLAVETVLDNAGPHGPDARPDGCYHVAAEAYAEDRLIVFDHPVQGTDLSVRLVRVGIGSAHEDTAIAEVFPLLTSCSGLLASVARAVRTPVESLRGASVQDVRDLYVNPYRVVGLPGERRPEVMLVIGNEGPIPVYPVSADLGVRTRNASEVYVATFWESFRNAALLVTEDGIVTGIVSRMEGDGEWSELRPQITVGPDGAVRSARVVVSLDGSPGCTDNVGALRSTPTLPPGRPYTISSVQP